MDPTQPNTTPTAEPPTAPAPQSSPAPSAPAQAFTAEQVAQMVAAAEKKAHDAAYAAARRTFEERAKAPPTQPNPQPATPTQAAPTAPSTTSVDIARVVLFTTEATKLGIPPKGVELLLSRMDVEKPADVSSWVAQQAADYGWKQPTQPATTAATVTPPTAPAAAMPPVTSNAAPSSPARMTDDVPLIDRSPSEQEAFRQQHGFVEFTNRVMREARERGTRLRLR